MHCTVRYLAEAPTSRVGEKAANFGADAGSMKLTALLPHSTGIINSFSLSIDLGVTKSRNLWQAFHMRAQHPKSLQYGHPSESMHEYAIRPELRN